MAVRAPGVGCSPRVRYSPPSAFVREMGNDQSKREPEKDPSLPSASESHSLPQVTTRPVRELVSRPVDPRCYETPDTPTSDLSFSDSELDDVVFHERHTLRSYDPQWSQGEEELALTSLCLQRMVDGFVHGTESMQFIVGSVELSCAENVSALAKCVGFESCVYDAPNLRMERSGDVTETERRTVMVHQSLESYGGQLHQMGVKNLDAAMEESLVHYLKQSVQESKTTEHEFPSFLLPPESVKRIYNDVATDLQMRVQITHESQITLMPDGKTERTIQKGELVWRRLQHWSTNVRKEKKFNIWAKGLANDVKERILEIAIEIGFETAMIQQNGNIHLEIKPPEGQHRRKLKHATEELRMELEPIDEAVCQNVEQHLQEWLLDFHENGKQKDILNCRFVLPAEWLRQTSERLASQYGLLVSMQTGIELLFHRPDVDLSSVQESATTKEQNSKKSKSKNRAKKKVQEPSVNPEVAMNGHPGYAEHDGSPPMPFDEGMNDPSNRGLTPTTSSHLATGNNRRASSRNKYDYGWDPSWPTAHPDRAATSQHTY